MNYVKQTLQIELDQLDHIIDTWPKDAVDKPMYQESLQNRKRRVEELHHAINAIGDYDASRREINEQRALLNQSVKDIKELKDELAEARAVIGESCGALEESLKDNNKLIERVAGLKT